MADNSSGWIQPPSNQQSNQSHCLAQFPPQKHLSHTHTQFPLSYKNHVFSSNIIAFTPKTEFCGLTRDITE